MFNMVLHFIIMEFEQFVGNQILIDWVISCILFGVILLQWRTYGIADNFSELLYYRYTSATLDTSSATTNTTVDALTRTVSKRRCATSFRTATDCARNW